VLDKSALYGSSQELFCAAGMAAGGCHARCTKNMRAAAGGEESGI